MINYGVKINVGGNAATVMGQLFTISQKLDAIMQKLDVTSKKLGSTYRRTGTEAQQATQKAETGFKRVSRAIVDARDKLKSLNFGFNGLGSTLAGLGLSIGAVDIARRVYNAGTTEESTYARLKFALGSDKAAADMMARLKAIGKNSTSPLAQIYQNAGFLAPVFKEETDKYLKMFSTVVAGSGGDFGNIAFNFSQIKQAGKPELEDIKQFAYNNIPIFEELGKVLGVSVQQVRKLQSDGKITFDMIAKAFENMTSKGGIYYGALESQANTFRGKMQIIGNKLQEIFVKLFDKARPYLEQFAKKLEDIIDNFDEWWPTVKKIGETLLYVFAGTKIIGGITTLISSFKSLFTIIKLTGNLLLGWPGIIASISGGIYLLIDSMTKMQAKAYQVKLGDLGDMTSEQLQKKLSQIDDKISGARFHANNLRWEKENDKSLFGLGVKTIGISGEINAMDKQVEELESQRKEVVAAIKTRRALDELEKAQEDAKKSQSGYTISDGITDSGGGHSGGGGIKNFQITFNSPVVQIDSNHVDTRQYTAEQIGDLAAKEFINIMTQVAVQ